LLIFSDTNEQSYIIVKRNYILNHKYFSYNECLTSIDEYATKLILEDRIPDLIVGVGTGGLVPAVLLANKFNIKVANLGIRSRNAVNGTIQEVANIYQDVDWDEFPDVKNVLVVDDLYDTGYTLIEIYEHLKDCGKKITFYTILLGEKHPVDDIIRDKFEYSKKFNNKDTWIDFFFEKQTPEK
jgi:hypoxanthine phosphoribosyltransferase